MALPVDMLSLKMGTGSRQEAHPLEEGSHSPSTIITQPAGPAAHGACRYLEPPQPRYVLSGPAGLVPPNRPAQAALPPRGPTEPQKSAPACLKQGEAAGEASILQAPVWSGPPQPAGPLSPTPGGTCARPTPRMDSAPLAARTSPPELPLRLSGALPTLPPKAKPPSHAFCPDPDLPGQETS